MLRPDSRCQSPISTANANAVNVATPRRHPSLATTGVNGLSAAITAIAASNLSRRSTAASTHLDDLAQVQQPREMPGITGISLDPVP